MPRPDMYPDYDDSHLPAVGTATAAELAAASGFKPRQPGARTAKGEQRSLTLQARDLRAIELAAAGATYDQIAKILGLATRTSARQLLERALARRALEIQVRDLPAAKALQADRLDGLWRRWFPLAVGRPPTADDPLGIPPSERAANVVLSIHDRMARLHGLDAPVKVEHEVVVTSDEEERERRERILVDLAEVARRHASIHPPEIEGTWKESA